MRIPKELDEKLREFLAKTEKPLNFSLRQTAANVSDENFLTWRDSIRSLSLRAELIKILDSSPVKGKYKQLDLEEEIEKSKI